MYYSKEVDDLAIRLIKRSSRKEVNKEDKAVMLEAVEMLVKLRRECRRLDAKARGPHYDEHGVWVDGDHEIR